MLKHSGAGGAPNAPPNDPQRGCSGGESSAAVITREAAASEVAAAPPSPAPSPPAPRRCRYVPMCRINADLFSGCFDLAGMEESVGTGVGG